MKKTPSGWAVISKSSVDFKKFCNRFECVCTFAVAENVGSGKVELCRKLASEYIR